MKKESLISILFIIAALYDGIIGGIFLCSTDYIFTRFGVTPPNHPGYVHFPAALLMVFAIMFTVIALDPINNRRLIPYGILLKISYCGTVFFHWFNSGIPFIWKPFAVADLIFLAAFFWAFATLKSRPGCP